jgi:hypothetical protein
MQQPMAIETPSSEFQSTMDELSDIIASTAREAEFESVIAGATPRGNEVQEDENDAGDDGVKASVPAAWDDDFWSEVTPH